MKNKDGKVCQYSFIKDTSIYKLQGKGMKKEISTRKYNHYLYDFILYLKLSPKKFAESLGFDRADRIYNVLRGVNGVSEDLAKIIEDKYPNVSYEWLLGEGDKMLKRDQLNVPPSNAKVLESEKEPEVLITKAGNTYYIYPNNETYIEVDKLRFKAYASYVEAFTDRGQLNVIDGSKIRFKIDKVHFGYYLGFETVNDSMNGGGINDTPGGAEVLGRELLRVHWRDGFNDSQYGWILLTKSNIYHKDIKSFDKETGKLVLSSRDGITEDFDININDVYRIFKVCKRNF